MSDSKKHLISPPLHKEDSVYADALMNLVRHLKHPEDHDNTPTHHSHTSDKEEQNIIRIEMSKAES